MEDGFPDGETVFTEHNTEPYTQHVARQQNPAHSEQERLGFSAHVGVETGALRGKLSDTPPRQEMYLPWELQAMGTTCHPPEGTPTRCCTGSSSRGGNVNWTPKHGCKAAPYARLPDHSSESVSTLLKHLSATNQTMGFTGDSLMYQLVVGFECEWLRQGWTTTHHTQVPRTNGTIGAMVWGPWKNGL